jgi:hypothetical protein
MGTDAKPAQAKLKAMRGKLPAKAPQYLQSDYKMFITKADDFMNDLNTLVTSEGLTTSSRDDYSKKKQALADLKKKINDAVKVQQAKVTDLFNEISPLNKSVNSMLDTLKDKKSKEETALSDAIVQFVTTLQTISNLEAPPAVD